MLYYTFIARTNYSFHASAWVRDGARQSIVANVSAMSRVGVRRAAFQSTMGIIALCAAVPRASRIGGALDLA